ncbi:MAG TPA: RidA family protein [Puia sp.]|nr:RidA family protein [Puia sp.]
MKSARRSALKKLAAALGGTIGLGLFAKSNAGTEKPMAAGTKEAKDITTFQEVPLFSGSTRHGDLVYIAGKGAHVEPFEIKAHTEIVLKELENALIKAGSSMEKVLKVTVFLNDIADYQAMNEVYKGRFGEHPPVRTTVAVAKGGVPGNSLVEMDAIAYV